MKPVYRKYLANGKTYYVWIKPVTVDIGHNIWVDTHNPESRGYGGRTLEFMLEDGRVDKVKGPWHTNDRAFLQDTGIDVTDLTLTRVVISTERVSRQSGSQPGGRIIYKELEEVLGDYYRSERIGQQLVDILNEPLYVFSYSNGGSSSSLHKPGGKVHPLAPREWSKGVHN